MALAGLRKGSQYMNESSGKWTQFISWKDGDVKTVAFVTPMEEVPKVRIHNFVKIPDESERGFRYATFMCRKDPAWRVESGDTCPLCDVIHHEPIERHVAIAVELDPIRESGTKKVKELHVKTREVERDDGSKASYPQWGLVIQSDRNFWGYFMAFAERMGNINDVAFDVLRQGGDQNTKYPVFPIQEAPLPQQLEDLKKEIPTLEGLLEEMGSLKKYEAELQGVEPDSQTGYNGSGEETPSTDLRTKFDAMVSSLPQGYDNQQTAK